MAAFLKMKRRKQEWVEKTEEEFRTLRERAMQLA